MGKLENGILLRRIRDPSRGQNVSVDVSPPGGRKHRWAAEDIPAGRLYSLRRDQALSDDYVNLVAMSPRAGKKSTKKNATPRTQLSHFFGWLIQ